VEETVGCGGREGGRWGVGGEEGDKERGGVRGRETTARGGYGVKRRMQER